MKQERIKHKPAKRSKKLILSFHIGNGPHLLDKTNCTCPKFLSNR